MRQYIDTLQDVQGNALVGATVLVQNYVGAANASIFSDNGLTPIANSTVTTGADGQFSFYAADGDYNLVMSKNATVFKTQSPVSMFDGAAQITYADTGAVNVITTSNSALEKALRTGLRSWVKVGHTTTGAATYSYNGLAAKAIVNPDGTTAVGGSLVLNGIYQLEYNGTAWQLSSPQLQLSYGTTGAEAAAGVTPTSFAYPPGDFRRYGATDVSQGGSTDSTAAITTALSIVQQSFAASGCTFLSTGNHAIVAGASVVGPGKVKLSGGTNSLFNFTVSNVFIRGLQMDCTLNGNSGTGSCSAVTIAGTAVANIEVSDCTINGGRIVENGTATTNLRIKRNYLFGNSVGGATGGAGVTGGVITIGASAACSIFEVIENTVGALAGTDGVGIAIFNNSTFGKVALNHCSNCYGCGILVQSLQQMTVADNICESNGRTVAGGQGGIVWQPAAGGGNPTAKGSISGNICRFNGVDGFDINVGPTVPIFSYLEVVGNHSDGNGTVGNGGTGFYIKYASNSSFVGNTAFGNATDGFYFQGGSGMSITANIAVGNGSNSPGNTYNGITLNGATGCAVHANVATNTGGSANQQYGIAEVGSANGNSMSGNICAGNVVGTTLLLGALSVLKDDVGGYIDQGFTLAITNSAGTLQHAIYGQTGALLIGNYSSRINNASAANTNTPTGTDSSTAFAAGGKISSVTPNNFILDTAPQNVSFTDGAVTLEYNSTTTALLVRLQILSQNVNGVTQYRPNLSFSNATTGAAVNLNTTNIPASATIQLRFRGRLF